MLACLWLLIQFVSQASALDSATAGRPAGDAVVAVVAIAVLTASRDVAASPPSPPSPASPQPPSAPGVTRTPGQRFRKPLLYPPELQGHIRGRKRRNVGELGVVQQGLDAPSLQPLPTLQEIELDERKVTSEPPTTRFNWNMRCLTCRLAPRFGSVPPRHE